MKQIVCILGNSRLKALPQEGGQWVGGPSEPNVPSISLLKKPSSLANYLRQSAPSADSCAVSQLTTSPQNHLR